MTLPWPPRPPTAHDVVLRAFTAADLPMVGDLATDEYVPLVSTLAARADEQEALAWIERQRGRHVEGTGWSFCVAERTTDDALGQVGLWPTKDGRAHVGYAIGPSARGRGIAARALAVLVGFAWDSGLERLEAYIEPWNAASLRTAEGAGFSREGLLRSHQRIGGTRRDMVLLAQVR